MDAGRLNWPRINQYHDSLHGPLRLKLLSVTAVFVVVLALNAAGLTQAQNTRAQTRNLEIYWVDIEGGAATLFVSPTGESLLFDTGYPGNGDRDSKRLEGSERKKFKRGAACR